METESQDIINERVKNLPPEVRDALASDELSTKIHTIGNKHHLHIDQIGTLEDEVVLAMMGLSEVTELSNQLVEQLNISKTDADALVEDINGEIFLPIQDAMKKVDSGKSVVMPSSTTATIKPAAPAAAVAPIPAAKPSTPLSTDMQINAPAPLASKSEIGVPLHEADIMLRTPTVSIPPKAATSAAPATPLVTKTEPPKPAPIYKADPYREPIE